MIPGPKSGSGPGHVTATVRAANETTLTFTGHEIGDGTIPQIASTRTVPALVDDLF